MQIITGYTGKPHVTAEHDRDINIGLFGAKSYVLPTGMMMEAEISSNNEIKIRDGVLMHQGCAGSIKKNTYDSVTITNGSQGMKRIDLIVVRYEKNEDTETEELKWVVLQGIPSEDAPETPDYTQGDIQAGDYVADMPMYEVTIDGLNITQIKKVFETTESLTELNGKLHSYHWEIYEFSKNGTVTKAIPWDEYMYLVFGIGSFGNIENSIIVLSPYFSGMTTGKRVQLRYSGMTIEIYPNGNGSITMNATGTYANSATIKILCICKM